MRAAAAGCERNEREQREMGAVPVGTQQPIGEGPGNPEKDPGRGKGAAQQGQNKAARRRLTRRLSGRKVTRPARVRSRCSVICVATASVSTTTLKSALPATCSTAAL